MGKMDAFKKKNTKIIDTVEYNGRYTDVNTVRTKIIAASAVIIAAAACIVVQLFWF